MGNPDGVQHLLKCALCRQHGHGSHYDYTQQNESMDLEPLESLKVPIWDLPQVHKTHVGCMVKLP